MKKLLTLVCAFAFICALGFGTAGCGKKDKTTTTAPAATTAPATTTGTPTTTAAKT